MSTVLGEVANVILPVLLCVSVGYTLALARAPFDRKIMGSIVANVGYPSLVMAHLSSGHVSFDAFVHMVGAILVLIACFAVIALLVLSAMRLPIRAFLAPMTLGNVGNIGLPVATLAFGEAGLSYALAFVVIVIIGMFTYGQWLPQGRVTLRTVLTAPVLYAIPVALVLLATKTPLPGPLFDTFNILGGLSIPLMLLILGHTLAGLNVAAFGRGLVLSIIHIVMALGCSLALASLFGLTGTERGVFITLAAMPSSVATYLFVELYAPESAREVASFIVISTALTVLVLPLVLAYAV